MTIEDNTIEQLKAKLEELSRRMAELEEENERNQLVKAVRDSEKLFQTLFDNVSVGMALVDPNGHVTAANEADCLFLGYSQDELVGMHFEEFTYPEDLATDIHLFESLMKGERTSYVVDKRYVRKDGETVWGRLNVALIRDEYGNAKYTAVVCEDITERKLTAEALLESKKQLELKTKNLEEVNIALKVLIEQREQENLRQQKNMIINLEHLVFPYLEKLQKALKDRDQETYVDIIKANLGNMTSSFASRMLTLETGLTPTELKVVELLRQGKTTKEIADLLVLSVTTISFHRRNIRKKLGLLNKKVNLRSYLQTETDYFSENRPTPKLSP